MRKLIREKSQLIILIASLMLAFVVVSFLFGVTYFGIQRDQITIREKEVTVIADQVLALIKETSDVVSIAAYNVDTLKAKGESEETIKDYLTTTFRAYTKIIDGNISGLYGVFDGKYISGDNWVPPEDFDPLERPWYTETMASSEDVTIVSPYLDLQTGTVMISLAKRLNDQRSVVSLDLNLDGIRKIIKGFALEDQWNSVMILDDNAFVIAHSDRTEVGKVYKQEEDTLGRKIAERLVKGHDTSFRVAHGGKDYLVFVSELEQGWHVVTVTDMMVFINYAIRISLASFSVMILVFIFMFTAYRIFRKKQITEKRFSTQLKAISRIYVSICQINLDKDTYNEITMDESLGQIRTERHEGAQIYVRMYLDELTEDRFKKAVYNFIDFKTLRDRLKGKSSITREFISTKNERCNLRFVPINETEDGTVRSVIMLLEKIS